MTDCKNRGAGQEQAAIRKHAAAARENLDNRRQKEEALRTRVMNWLSDNPQIRQVFIYASYRSEADTLHLIRELLEKGYRVLCPKVSGREMVFYAVGSPSSLKPGYRGIPEPDDSDGAAAAEEPDEASLMICPGLIFDRTGGRIGYGGGFYDRYLSLHRVLKAGFGFSDQISGAELPLKSHDIRMDLLFTDEEILDLRSLQEKP